MSANPHTVTVTFSPEEQAAFLARTDRLEGETIISPYVAFVDHYLNGGHSIGLVDQTEWVGDAHMDDIDFPLVAPSGYVVELVTEDCAKQFAWHSRMIRAQVNELNTFKAKWPFIVTVREYDRDRPDIPDDFPVNGDLTAFLFAEEIGFAKINAKGGFDTFASDIFEDEVVHFGFARHEEAALFKLFHEGAQ
jgi:hypothetical protein